MRWIMLVLFGVLQVIAGFEDIPTYFIHERCGQSINLRRESVFMAKVEILPVVVTSGLVGARSNDRGLEVQHYSHQSGPCIFNIESWSFQNRLMVNFEEISSASEMGCSKPVLEIFDGPSEDSPRISGLANLACHASSEDPMSLSLATSDIHLTFRYHGNSSSRLRASIVAFHEGPCRSYEHHCLNGRCIMSELTCNGHNPCGDFSDCPTTELPEEVDVSNSDHILIVVMVSTSATLLCLIACIVVLYKCYQLRKKHTRLHRHHEYPVTSQTPIYVPRQIGSTSPQPVYERTVSQIEADRRFAPPSYSQLPVVEAETEVETSESEDDKNASNERRLEILSLQDCLNIDENNPPSYACVMLHQEEFNVSEPNIHSLVMDCLDAGTQNYSGDNESSGDET